MERIDSTKQAEAGKCYKVDNLKAEKGEEAVEPANELWKLRKARKLSKMLKRQENCKLQRLEL